MEGHRRFHMQDNYDMSMNRNCEPNGSYFEGMGGMQNGLYYNTYEDDQRGNFSMGREGNVYMGNKRGMMGDGGLQGGRGMQSDSTSPDVIYNRNFNINSSQNYNTGGYHPSYNSDYSGMNYQMMNTSGSANYAGSMMNMSSPNPYPNDEYVLNRKAAKILYIHNITSRLADENFIYSLCSVYGNVESVSYMKGKNLFIVKFECSDSALSAYKYLPTHFKSIHLELRNESRKISYFNEKANSNKYISPNISEKKFLSLSIEKREHIMSIKQKELLRKCKEKLNQYINMFNNKNITEGTKEKLKCLIDHLKTRIEALNNECSGGKLLGGNSSSGTPFNNYDTGALGIVRGRELSGGSLNRKNNPIGGGGGGGGGAKSIRGITGSMDPMNSSSTTIKINYMSNMKNNEQLGNYIAQNNSIFLNEHICYFSLFSFGERYAIIKYNNENIARNVFKNCKMYNINVEFVQDDADGYMAS
ncbi:conserved Plasmodium protein, unknown function [Plasmodium knowlesi strain H]|uniref:RRM domain-containing protein n=3 Tax=Plasmodium knowlesi TaxID=5850 RepID=A0A5K1UF16_PLAKH|nr:RNA-binding protein, putative [Plasmodium knowlesi strain H]OTN64800.1 Uncharacterized protein PKNOH_S130214300 [Plasmodium knowlesi]CAA9989303.1 RNA-binding protein, putative [Plasmodium knowlesi strain H]SBO26121.1 conserved Plasmodium protein, unknown function [Plasmodium knowlesi strain H]SBO26786.1 conserved Plasmodium protein, unknown function [Plasmodium knowlesi strain H]VVS78777.1 RNA-binding protein, putative [Plasmodium knowlesi strain H]|eukprot:XP_002261650.1 hypothetical protein, conserved in Plasmodium species [Plasmodium knowlesi strain H]